MLLLCTVAWNQDLKTACLHIQIHVYSVYLVRKINPLNLIIILSGTHFINPSEIFLPCHVTVIITYTSIILAKAFSKHKICCSTGEQSLNSKKVNSFISVNAFVTVSCKR